MPLTNGPTLTSPTTGQVLAEVVFPWPRTLRALFVISATYPIDLLVETWNAAETVMQDFVLLVNSPLWSSPMLGPFNIPANGRLRVVVRSTPAVMPSPHEVQANIFWKDWAER